jgi:hypothetical protein
VKKRSGRKPREYRVTWVIEVEAGSAVAAAREAFASMNDPDTLATVFTVKGGPEGRCSVDLRPDEGAAVVVDSKGRKRRHRLQPPGPRPYRRR